MKTLLAILILFIASVAWLVYSYKTPPTTEIVLLNDVTDKYLSQVDSTSILSLYQLKGDEKWNGAKLRFSNIIDVSLNRFQVAKILPANKWLSNEQDRERQIHLFESDVSKIVQDTENDSIGRRYSSVYLPMARELNLLSESKSESRILIIYSDLMENDLDVSLYAKDEFRLLQFHPESLIDTLEKRQPLNNLSGIEVIIIYQPEDVISDKSFGIVSGFYKNLLEQKGAQVTIKANL